MNVSQLHAEVVPGAGVVAYFGASVLVAVGVPDGQGFVAELLTLVQAGGESGGPGSGRSLMRRVAELIERTPAENTVAFAVAADDGPAIDVMLHGSAAMRVMRAEQAAEEVSAPGAGRLERVVSGELESLTLRCSPADWPAPAAALTALRPGVFTGTGIRLTAATATDATVQPAAGGFASRAVPSVDAQPSEPFVSVLLRPTGEERAALQELALQTSGAPADAAAASLGSLLLADRSIVPVSGNLILGREPENSPRVADGSAKALALSDPDRRLSRVHALLSVTPTGATLTDLGSANGTSIMQPGESGWTALTSQQPVAVLPGARIKIAGQELQFIPQPSAPAQTPDTPAEPQPEPAHEPAAQAAPAETGGSLHGIADYVFARRLGSGDRGSYFLAAPPQRLNLDVEYVVVKVVAGPTSDDAFRRATRELRAFAAAGSQYLIKVHDAGQHQGLLFYSMDYIAGGSLDEPKTHVSDEAATRAVAQAGRAAHALHEVGVVHQGIAPKRILLGDDHAYLADLGLAQLITPESFATSIGDFDGLEFLDPALLTGARGSQATDLWSLAATLNWALAGVGVFGPLPKDPLLAVRTVLTRKPAPSEGLAPEVSTIIAACLEPDHSARPATALEFAKSLEVLL